MPDRRQRAHVSACEGKRGYDDYAEAQRALDRTVANYEGRADAAFTRLKVYRCRSCGRYHVGNGYKAPPKLARKPSLTPVEQLPDVLKPKRGKHAGRHH